MDIYYLHLQQFALKERLSVARYGQQKNNNKLVKCIYVRKFSFIDWRQTFKTFVILLYICCLFFCFMYTTCYLRQYSILQIVSKSNGEKTWASLRGKIMCAREKSRCPRKKCVRCFLWDGTGTRNEEREREEKCGLFSSLVPRAVPHTATFFPFWLLYAPRLLQILVQFFVIYLSTNLNKIIRNSQVILKGVSI